MMSAQLSIHTEQASGETARAPETAAAPKEPTEITTRQRLATLRLVREGSFSAPSGYPSADVPIRSPRKRNTHTGFRMGSKVPIRFASRAGMCLMLLVKKMNANPI